MLTSHGMRFWVTLGALWLTACAGGTHEARDGAPVLSSTTSYVPKLGPSDVIELRVFREEELDGVHRISEEGEINVPLIGRVKVAGMTVEEAAEVLRSRFADGFLNHPEVSVFVKELHSRKIHVLGEVKRSGSFPYEPGMSIIEALTYAGGLGNLANSNGVRVTRSEGGSERHFVVRVDRIRNGDAPNFVLLPGDIVFVPEAIF
jgi:protein involved in polysaccharide export with SLBB domain